MLSVGIYTYSTRPRGSVVHAAALAEALVAAGHDATLYALAKPGAAFFRPLSCPLVLFAAKEAPSDENALVSQRVDEFCAGLEQARAIHDIHHAQDCLAASALLAATGRHGTPIARTVHHVERFESPYLAACQARSILEADAVFSVSRHTQARVLEEFGRRSEVVPNGVNAERFDGVSDDVLGRWRTTLGLTEGDVVVLSIGGVEPRKNSRFALASFARASASCPALRWVVVGAHSLWDHSDYAAAFDADLARLPSSVRARVARVGSVAEADMTALYRLSDILLCVSKEEGFGLAVLEALAAGVPVVVPRRSPFTEYVDTSCGRLVNDSSVEDVSDALVSIGGDPVARAALGFAGRDRARLWPWSKTASEQLLHYRTTCVLSSRDAGARDARSLHA